MKTFKHLLILGFFLAMVTNINAQVNQINDTGSVGIGTLSPQQPLDVRGNANVEGDISIKDSMIVDDGARIKGEIISTNGLFKDTLKVKKFLKVNGNAKILHDLVVNDTLKVKGLLDVRENARFIGTVLMKDTVIMKEFLKVKSDAKIVGDLDLNGTLYVNKIQTDTMTLNRITSTDSLIYFGEHTIVMNTNMNRIYADQSTSNYAKGMGLGYNTLPFGVNSVAIGHTARTIKEKSIAIGNNAYTYAEMSFAYGNYVRSDADNNFVFGSGNSNGLLINKNENSMMFGVNSQVAAMFITEPQEYTINNISNPHQTTITGNVGISTTAPKDKLQIGDGVESVTIGSAVCAESEWALGYIGFNAKRNRTEMYHTSDWVFSPGPNGNASGAAIFSANGELRLSPVSQSYIQQNGNVLTDKQMFELSVVRIWGREIDPQTNQLSGGLMAVNGKIECMEVEVHVDVNRWWDDVFEEEYELMSLEEVEAFIQEHKHLPGVPSEQEVTTEGLQLGEMQGIMMKKIEELTLYVIQLQKENLEMKEEINRLKQ
jgi:cytoskeletal protein CcmA (bactofilin family)